MLKQINEQKIISSVILDPEVHYENALFFSIWYHQSLVLGWGDMQVSVDVEDAHQSVQLRATSSAISFPGFLAVYKVRNSWSSSSMLIMFNPAADSELKGYKATSNQFLGLRTKL